MKNSFIMFNNYKDFFDKLTNEEAGELIKAIIDYSNYGETGYSFKSVKAECYFTVIKQHLDSNTEKYEKTVERNKENVSKRWNKLDTTVSSGKKENTKNTIGKNKIPKDTTVSNGIKSYKVVSSGKKENTKNTDNDNDNDIDNDIDNNNIYISSEQQVATEPETTPDEEEMIEAVIVPEELKGLNLYENNEKLLKLWPELIEAWKNAFPGINIIAEVKAAHAWEVANPKRRKVDKARFLQNWMARAQDSHGGKIIGGKNKSTEYDFGGE